MFAILIRLPSYVIDGNNIYAISRNSELTTGNIFNNEFCLTI